MILFAGQSCDNRTDYGAGTFTLYFQMFENMCFLFCSCCTPACGDESGGSEGVNSSRGQLGRNTTHTNNHNHHKGNRNNDNKSMLVGPACVDRTICGASA